MLEFLIAVGDGDFRFDTAQLTQAARERWPQAQVFATPTDTNDVMDAYNDLPHASPHGPQLALMRGGDGIGVDAPTREDAAEVIAWLRRTADVPDDDTVVLIEWTDDLHPLSAQTTTEELLALPAP